MKIYYNYIAAKPTKNYFGIFLKFENDRIRV